MPSCTCHPSLENCYLICSFKTSAKSESAYSTRRQEEHPEPDIPHLLGLLASILSVSWDNTNALKLIPDDFIPSCFFIEVPLANNSLSSTVLDLNVVLLFCLVLYHNILYYCSTVSPSSVSFWTCLMCIGWWRYVKCALNSLFTFSPFIKTFFRPVIFLGRCESSILRMTSQTGFHPQNNNNNFNLFNMT